MPGVTENLEVYRIFFIIVSFTSPTVPDDSMFRKVANFLGPKKTSAKNALRFLVLGSFNVFQLDVSHLQWAIKSC